MEFKDIKATEIKLSIKLSLLKFLFIFQSQNKFLILLLDKELDLIL
tara:strand:+ start:493 stop:630 length:138 start_codon:yes stop_codon:yes gene_type:complete